jgi:hypothetical protein
MHIFNRKDKNKMGLFNKKIKQVFESKYILQQLIVKNNMMCLLLFREVQSMEKYTIRNKTMK